MPKDINKLMNIQQLFSEILLIKEPRNTQIPTFELVSCMVFYFHSQTKDAFTLESLRREIILQTGKNIQRSSFSERLNTEKLNRILLQLFSQLLLTLPKKPFRGKEICKTLGIQDIYLIDSSSFLLPKEAREHFKGTFNKASLKYHLCLSLLSGDIPYWDFSPASSHDRNYFPEIETLKNKLLLFDLAYYDFSYLKEMKNNNAFFFSRIKKNSNLEFTQIKQGIPEESIGKKVMEFTGKKYYKKPIDAVAKIEHKEETLELRTVGFYNKKEGCYHFYITNLKVDVKHLEKLYSLRWQQELVFKGYKQSIGLKKYPSAKPLIIQNLFLASLIAQVLALHLFQISSEELNEEECNRISFQRIFLIMNLLANDFKNYILSVFKRKEKRSFEEKFQLFIIEFSDPDKKRKNSLQMISLFML